MRMIQKLRRFSALFLALFMATNVILAALPAHKALAAGGGSAISTPLYQRVQQKNAYMFLRYCFENSTQGGHHLSSDDVNGWDYFNIDDSLGDDYEVFSIVGNIYGANGSATKSCEDGNNVGDAFQLIGFTDSKRVFCELDGLMLKDDSFGDTTYPDNEECYSRDVGSHAYWRWDGGNYRENFENMVKSVNSKVQGSGTNPWLVNGLKDEENYVRSYLSFMNQCGANDKTVQIIKDSYAAGDADPDNRYQLPIVDQKGKVTSVLAEGKASNGSQVALEASIGGSEYKLGDGENKGDLNHDLWPRGEVENCNQVVTDLRDKYTTAYSNYLKTHPNDEFEDSGSLLSSDPQDPGSTAPTCESENGDLAWIGCGILRMMDGVVGALDGAISNLLFIDDDKFDNDSVSNAWAVMRNVALLLLIPMMLFMVIGTALEFGPFDAYTVKKSLPRMVAAVIFIVLSLALTQFAIKLSNSVGGGVANLVYSAMPEGQKIGSLHDVFCDSTHGASGCSEGALFTGLSAGGLTIAGLTGAITWGVLGSLALVTIVALLIGAIILIVRQVLVIFLMILAPLAILVWIFPGNDKLWKIWKTTFIAMLLMYPIIMLLIVSGRFFAGIV